MKEERKREREKERRREGEKERKREREKGKRKEKLDHELQFDLNSLSSKRKGY